MYIKSLCSSIDGIGERKLIKAQITLTVGVLFSLFLIGLCFDIFPNTVIRYLIPVFYCIACLVSLHIGWSFPRRNTFILLGLFLFSLRIAFFPALVIAGYFASLLNSILWLFLEIQAPHTFFFPIAYLVMMAFGIFLLFSLSVGVRRLFGIAAVSMCCMISFTALKDVRLIDPLLYSIKLEDIGTECHEKKNYYQELLEKSSNVSSSFLLLNAAITYELIPPSPWGREVRDRLACLAYRNPDGSSLNRLEEHFRVFLTIEHTTDGRSYE